MHRNLQTCFALANDDYNAVAEWAMKHKLEDQEIDSDLQCWA